MVGIVSVRGFARMLLGVIVAACAVQPMALSAFDVPKGVYMHSGLDDARMEAYEEKEPVLLLYTDPKLKPS